MKIKVTIRKRERTPQQELAEIECARILLKLLEKRRKSVNQQ